MSRGNCAVSKADQRSETHVFQLAFDQFLLCLCKKHCTTMSLLGTVFVVECTEPAVLRTPSEFKHEIGLRICCICSFFFPPFTRKRIVSLYFERDVRTRLGVAIFEVSGPSVFHIKAEASR